MIVGQEWGAADFAAQSLLQGQEDMTEGGLAVLRSWIALAGLDLQQCFFTNTYLFIRPINNDRGTTPAIGIHYIDACRAAFCDVFKLVRPKIVVLCGNDALYLAQGFETEPSLSAYDGIEDVFAHIKQPLRLNACGFDLRVFISPHWEYAQPNFENPLMPAVTPASVESIWKQLGEELRADATDLN